MVFDYKVHVLNSYRHGLITNDKMYGKPTIFFNCETQHESIYKIEKYKNIFEKCTHNVFCLPYDLTGHEPGDNYEIYFYHENKLNTPFHVNEKINGEHSFFTLYGKPQQNFTNYIFDSKLTFIKSTVNVDEVLNV
jgi:hypothetical protein